MVPLAFYFKTDFMKHLLTLLFTCLLIMQAAAQPDDASGWNITATRHENYVPIAVANGRIGIMPSEKLFRVNDIYLNNVYDRESENGVSRILKGLNFANLSVWIDGELLSISNVTGWKQVLHMKEAYLETSFRFSDKAEVQYKIYALRNNPYLGVMDVVVKPLKDITLAVEGMILTPENYAVTHQGYKVLRDNEIVMPLLQTFARSAFGKHQLATSATFIFNHEWPELKQNLAGERDNRLRFEKKLTRGSDYAFAWTGSVCTTKDFADPQNESERQAIYIMRGNKEKLIADHVALWNELWQGDVIIEGDLRSQQDVRLALYHLYSFSRGDHDLSIPPMGLSSQIYNGHIFWDTELWMLPPLMVFHPELAASALNYRYNLLDKARQKANIYGYRGAMFPWESDDTGEEATPPFALTGTFEHHITADIGIACWNYYRVTGNKEWLQQKGYPIMKEVADFWVSRASLNADGSWSVKNVVGANEFAPNVDDNAFTNGSAKAILTYAGLAAAELNLTPSPQWKQVADNLKFHHFSDGVMMEHSAYKGEIIKQADVNLLAYPLQLVTERDQIIKDLEYYEPRISPEGPAMGHSILSILYARLGNSEMAWKLFCKSYYPNRREPFGAIAETPQFNNTYFATGAGGMLQAVLFGFAGLHITDKGIVQEKPCLPPHWKKLTIKGVGFVWDVWD